MIISDLNYLEVVSEAHSVEGGLGLLGINTSQTNDSHAGQQAGAYSQQEGGINGGNLPAADNGVVPASSKVFSA